MSIFTAADRGQLAARGITEAAAKEQLNRFVVGFPYLEIDSPSSVGAGIVPMDEELKQACLSCWDKYVKGGGEVAKFVPASGAASRMFKKLFEFVNSEDTTPAEGSDVESLIAHIKDFAFAPDLEEAVARLYGKSIDELKAKGLYKELVNAIIAPEGLNYGNLPKALLKFHRYGDECVTALEEQLCEAAEMAQGTSGAIRVHFTVSAAHEALFKTELARVTPKLEKKLGVTFDVSLSQQKPSTDTLAATVDNQPFRDENGKLVFRPGGHGALIENLGETDSAVVFIKNIDNIAKQSQRAESVPYKHLLGGMLIMVRERIAAIEEELCKAMEANDTVALAAALETAEAFMSGILCTRNKNIEEADDDFKAARAMLTLLDRPLRVCGMVRNEGEPGGGPYNVYSSDGMTIAPQILESSQIDLSKEANRTMMSHATHFNPVDLACCIKRADGSRYPLSDYVDPQTGFISSKSLNGRELKALELPGLWNGAMSNWNTVFIEVPALTFTPAKTVNDLLRPAHRG